MLLRVSSEDSRQRIDKFVSEKTGITRSQVQKLIETHHILVNGNPVKTNYKIKENDEINVSVPEKESEALVPENIPIDIIYKDDWLVVVNKPPDMVVYPSLGHAKGTLMNAICFHIRKLANVGAPLRPGVVHRLDKDTSGIMVIATSDDAYYSLVEQFKKRTINRSYTALVHGSLKQDKGHINLKVGRSETDRKKMSTRTRRGKEAQTSWEVIERFKNATLIRARLATGRTHQIRVHFASIGHPVLGDRTYGRKTFIEINKKRFLLPRQMLHAELLGFTHPITGEYMEFSRPVPEDMKEAIRVLRENVSSI